MCQIKGNAMTSLAVGITVWNKQGGLWFSSKWQVDSPPKTVEQTLGSSPGGGNLVVR